MDAKIPRRIIQTNKNYNLPLFAKAAVANIKLLNPSYEYLYFTDEDIDAFILKHFQEYYHVFHSFRYTIQKIDFFRYLAVHHYGGFYFDLDVFLATSLDDLLDSRCVFPFEELTVYSYLKQKYEMDWEIGNYAFGAAAQHPFVYNIIENCVRAQREPDWANQMLESIPRMLRERYYVLCTTGPGLITRTLAEYKDTNNPVRVLFPDNVCDMKSWHRFGSHGVHIMEGSWLNKKGILHKIYSRAWDTWMLKKVIREGMRQGESRTMALQK
jgi:inositol phosphorylceramide mannosyltransferase catalytic subunit